MRGIEGVASANGRVLGLMPHPEHAVDPLTGPRPTGSASSRPCSRPPPAAWVRLSRADLHPRAVPVYAFIPFKPRRLSRVADPTPPAAPAFPAPRHLWVPEREDDPW